MKKALCLVVLWRLLGTQTATSQHFLSPKLGFMYSMPLPKVTAIAKRLNKPIVIYLNSQNCSDSKRFSREVLNMPTVTKLLRTKYVCLNANVDSNFGNAIARKYKKLVMPVIIIINPDENWEYCCNLDLDTLNLLSQLNAFYAAFSLQEEIKFLVRTSSMNFNEASDKIASYYADRYIKENKEKSVEEFLLSQTLGLEYFTRYSKTFVLELERKKAMGASSVAQKPNSAK
ncbi:MAG: hypothetical protein EXR21_08535 [Flavobacteriaceae bacterium]|nr:hypothetical protein [Flavobacteriaceae bacterium]